MSERAAVTGTAIAAPVSTMRQGPTALLQRQCACGGSGGMTGECEACKRKKLLGQPLQRKLTISEPGDPYEQEADRVAEHVMRMPHPAVNGLQQAGTPSLIQRRATPGSTGAMEAPQSVHDVLSSPGQPLDAATREFFEPRFGHDFSHVRVHSGERAAQSARDVRAVAYTVGNNVVLPDGQTSMETQSGRRLLAHELTHVIQQTRGYQASNTEARNGLLTRKEKDSAGPEFTLPGWTVVNKLGIVYKEGGVNLREGAATTGVPLARLPQNTRVHLINHNPQSHWLAVTVVGDAFDKNCNRYSHVGKFGYVADDYVWWHTPLPDAEAVLYPVQSKDTLSKVVQQHCQYKTYNLKVGDDARSLAMAVYIASQSNLETKKGVKINESKFKKAQEDFNLVERIDPYRGGTQDLFDSVELVAGERVWLPGISYIEQLKQADIIPSRPDWMNTVVEVGKGVGGFTIGLVEGIVASIVDVFVGIYDIVSGIIKGMVSLVNGEALRAAADIIQVIKEMALEDVKQLGAELLKAIGGLIAKSLEDFVYRFWKDPHPYRKWHFRGMIVGYILAEVLMAIFTAAIANVVKWVGKLGKVGGKLAKLIEKILVKLEKLVPDRKKPKKDLDRADSSDGGEKAAQLPFALGAARMIAETHDAKNSSIALLLASLNPLKKKFRWIRKFGAKRKATAGHYEIVMYASEHTVDEDYTTPMELTEADILRAIRTNEILIVHNRPIVLVDTEIGIQARFRSTGTSNVLSAGDPGKNAWILTYGGAELRTMSWREYAEMGFPGMDPKASYPREAFVQQALGNAAWTRDEWIIKSRGGDRWGLPGDEARVVRETSDWIQQEVTDQVIQSRGQTASIAQLNGWLKKNGVKVGGAWNVGDFVLPNAPGGDVGIIVKIP